jgi:hypothetical protein
MFIRSLAVLVAGTLVAGALASSALAVPPEAIIAIL